MIPAGGAPRGQGLEAITGLARGPLGEIVELFIRISIFHFVPIPIQTGGPHRSEGKLQWPPGSTMQRTQSSRITA